MAPDRGSYRGGLAEALSGERRAYGFTLVVWGTGALVLGERGSPGVAGVAAYLGGILVAMALLLVWTFGSSTGKPPPSVRPHWVPGSIHVASVAVAVSAGAGLAAALPDKAAAYLVAGFVACLLFQLLIGAELALSVRRESRGTGS